MSLEYPIHFEFRPAKDEATTLKGWGQGILHVLGSPYWYSHHETQPQPIEWTWVDMLEYLAANWNSLVFEQSYPYPWLNDISNPGELWSAAERRWARVGEEVAEQEELRILAFERSHNLAAAGKGISLPALILMRAGRTCWICAEGKPPVRASFDQCRTALMAIGDTLATAFEASTHPSVASAVSRWRNRGECAKEQFFRLATGMPQRQLAELQGEADPFEFWEIAANDSWATGTIEEGPLLAAARMTAGIFDTTTIQTVLNAVRAVPLSKTERLDGISTAIRQSMQEKAADFAFSNGYLAASLVRESLQRDVLACFEIEDALVRLDVSVQSLSLGVQTIDAIAVWGGRGPCIILNKDRAYVTTERTRMTLAHELAHLVLDRTGGLPFCEVLGGAVDDFMERRAKAFAAELLLPRSAVENLDTTLSVSTGEVPIGRFVSNLKHHFGVSKSVVFAQIHNSSLIDRLSAGDRQFVEDRLRRGTAAVLSERDIRIHPYGDVL